MSVLCMICAIVSIKGTITASIGAIARRGATSSHLVPNSIFATKLQKLYTRNNYCYCNLDL